MESPVPLLLSAIWFTSFYGKVFIAGLLIEKLESKDLSDMEYS